MHPESSVTTLWSVFLCFSNDFGRQLTFTLGLHEPSIGANDEHSCCKIKCLFGCHCVHCHHCTVVVVCWHQHWRCANHRCAGDCSFICNDESNKSFHVFNSGNILFAIASWQESFCCWWQWFVAIGRHFHWRRTMEKIKGGRITFSWHQGQHPSRTFGASTSSHLVIRTQLSLLSLLFLLQEDCLQSTFVKSLTIFWPPPLAMIPLSLSFLPLPFQRTKDETMCSNPSQIIPGLVSMRECQTPKMSQSWLLWFNEDILVSLKAHKMFHKWVTCCEETDTTATVTTEATLLSCCCRVVVALFLSVLMTESAGQRNFVLFCDHCDHCCNGWINSACFANRNCAKRPGAIHIATLEHWLLWLLAAAFHVIFGAAKQKVREARAKILEGTSTFVDFGLFEYATWCSTQCCVFLNVRVEFCWMYRSVHSNLCRITLNARRKIPHLWNFEDNGTVFTVKRSHTTASNGVFEMVNLHSSPGSNYAVFLRVKMQLIFKIL